jgi:DNA-directed RNA polymerase subunit omega
MLYPSIDELTRKVDSKYSLVVAVAKRARQLQEGARPLTVVRSNKHVSMALQEIAEDLVTFIRPKTGTR